MQWLLDYELWFRLSFFIGLLALFIGLEQARPKRALSRKLSSRWLSNGLVISIDTIILRLLFPTAAVGVALWAQQYGHGLLNWLTVPGWLAILLAFVILDFAIWAQHLVFHRIPWLWRVHRMHHTDIDVDVTTALRFHPIEMVLSLLIKMAVIVLIGAPVVAVVLFEVVLNGVAMFNHSNIRLGAKTDRVLRYFIVTPDMHRVHHSWHKHETNSNYGFNLPWWDRLFATYRDQPEDGHDSMTLGINQFREPEDNRIHYILWQPFRGSARSASTRPSKPD
ncbi:fatty acid hydroxylase [Aliidiomarina minuta]|uniref:Fatty acid hydroxylase n=1 Tax=Aliidiomarina minuta TaxID=880057 RepID=A0A432W1C6_9GAMM|nr:sterol desaturase family protein [Aliidiomarina minuta]RUO23024.1 fatty acid hydroxylase [Aliidiomarina minuta]